jgi:hypothetical protein
MQCPGQDRAYWKANAVFEVPCPQCGASVELFRDESSGRCPNCGHRFLNPGADFGCAQWCSLAKECVGFAPDRAPAADATEGALAARLIQAIREESGGQSARLSRAVTVFRFAKELVVQEGGDPRVVLSAALLLESAVKAEALLRSIGMDEPTIERVCEIVDSARTGGALDTTEFKVVWDADLLARLAAEGPDRGQQKPADPIEPRLKTEAGRAKARTLSGPVAP